MTPFSLVHGFANTIGKPVGNDSKYYINYFTGPVPSSDEDVPSEWKTNFIELAKNSVGYSVVEAKHIVNEQEANQVFNFFDYKNSVVKRHWFFDNFGKWVLSPSAYYFEKVFDNVPEKDFYAQDISTSYALERMRYNPNIHWQNDDIYNYVVSGGHLSSNPIIQEYDHEVTVDSLFICQEGTSVSYSSKHVDISWYNSETDSWETGERVSLVEAGTNAYMLELSQTYTSNKFKFLFERASDRYASRMRFFQLCSSTEPNANTDPVDITWAIISLGGPSFGETFENLPDLELKNFETESTSKKTAGYPYLILDVGEAGDGTAISLVKSKQLSPGEPINFFDMQLKFEGI